MRMTSKVISPYPIFNDVDGDPLDAGYMYIGETGKNPEVYPVPVFFDENLSIPAPQPIRTRNGYISQSGKPAKLYIANEKCSVTIKNKRKTIIWTDLNADLSFTVDGLNKIIEDLKDEIDELSEFTQPESGFIERSMLDKVRDVQNADDYATLQQAADAKRSSTISLNLSTKQYTLTTPLNISQYAYIQGKGFYSRIKCNAGTGVVYNAVSVADDHAQRRLSDLQIVGDGTIGDYLTPKNGTTTGYSVTSTGHFAETHGLLLNGHATGMKIEKSYTNVNRYNYYRACKVGLHLKDVTSHREEMIYARYCSDAGVLIEGTTQNVSFNGGAVEGNRGTAIRWHNIAALAYPKLILNDLYVESAGDLAANVPAVYIEEYKHMHVEAIGGNFWNNVLSGIITGPYKWGWSAAFTGSAMNGYHYAKKMRICNTTDYALFNSPPDLATANLIGLVEPMLITEYTPSFRAEGLGNIFQVPHAGRPTRKMLTSNEATLSYPHILSKSVSTTISENTALNYGDGSWTDISFTGSGDYNNNYAQLTNLIDTSSNFISKVYVFLLKPTTDCQIGIVSTGSAATHQCYFQLKAGVTYRMCCFANRSSAGDYRMRLFTLSGAATISYLPIYLAKFSTTQEGINFANMFCTGAL